LLVMQKQCIEIDNQLILVNSCLSLFGAGLLGSHRQHQYSKGGAWRKTRSPLSIELH
jgi:hypothetical protein